MEEKCHKTWERKSFLYTRKVKATRRSAKLISQNTVAKVVQTFKKDGTATISQRRPGRPRKLTPRQERLLMRRVEKNQHASSLQLSKEVESQTGVTISCDTIRRTLQRNGMHGCRPRKKPLLKPRHKKARLEFAKLSLVNIVEMFFVFIEILFKILLFKGSVLIYAEHCTYTNTQHNLHISKIWYLLINIL